jgi:hypothetical protein
VIAATPDSPPTTPAWLSLYVWHQGGVVIDGFNAVLSAGSTGIQS